MTRILRPLASLRLTLAVLLALGLAVLYAYVGEAGSGLMLVPPLFLLSLNLIAAVATNPVFRGWSALLVFHLALIAIVLLLAAGRLTYLKGHVELAEGEEFGGTLTEVDAGPWHWSGLSKVHFINEGFRITYAAGLQRENTRNTVRYTDAGGVWQTMEIGDQTPLVLSGYRFYTSHNKGFAPAFLWHGKRAPGPVLGTVHLPSYPINEYRQALDWQLPGSGVKIWSMLQFNEVILDPEKKSEFRMPRQHKMIVRIGDLRREMQPGDAIDLPEGRLEYQGLRTWMGYTVFYDWTIHWLLAACVLAVAAMSWHFYCKFARQPWNGPA